MVITAAAAASISLGPSHCLYCHTEGIGCANSSGVTSSWIKPPFEAHRVSDHSSTSFRCENAFFGSTQFNWLPVGRDDCLSKVSVASDYSDSVPDSSNYLGNHGYHPLEELKDRKRARKTKLTSAEIAKTAVEANSRALLFFPGTVHCEPHDHMSWAQFQYVTDEYGDMFVEISDDENILQDCEASNPVSVLIGMDTLLSANRRVEAAELSNFEIDFGDEISSIDDYFEAEVEYSEMVDMPIGWGTSDSFNWVHPIYFSKCLTKAVSMDYAKNMDYPSNGVSIVGWLRPAFIDEESYLRKLFNGEDCDGYNSDWEDDKLSTINAKGEGSYIESTIYRLEIMRMELTSVYGIQSAISLQEFREAEADILVHSTPAIVERFSEKGIRSEIALTALCRKKGLHVEGANLIGVDSLGMDVRVISGIEVRTHRFPFKVRATSEAAAEKQIQQLLYPRSHRKKVGTHADGLGDPHLL